MPTPVTVARQCLADEAASALDEAVAVAKRRSHAQTTSLHAVSALISLPSSSIREACTRARVGACTPRLQYRALELSIGVALDRLSVAKSADEPPVSNSLMAAIKRSQANQRRHPDTFHLYQRQQLSPGSENFSISAVKVELKHFVMSILDDPIVSRVFGDAGFRTTEIKWAILNPIVTRFPSSSAGSRCSPLFLRSFSDIGSSKAGPNFPFAVDLQEKCDENSRRVGEVLMKSSKRNPLLVGTYAKDALRSFIDCLKRNVSGHFPREIEGLSVIEIGSGFVNGDFDFKKISDMLRCCHGNGFIVNCGDLKILVDAENVDVVNGMVMKLNDLLINSCGKLWVIGFLAGDDHYKKLVERFPSIEMDLDLHLLPITASSVGMKSFKSSLMGSFVPLGGFFPMPFEHDTLRTRSTQSPSLCNLCYEKYEVEVSEILRGATTTGSISDKLLPSLSPWLQIAQRETSNKSETIQAMNEKTVVEARVMALKKKWSDICSRIHSSLTVQENISKAKSQSFGIPSFQNVSIRRDSPEGLILNGSVITNLSPYLPSGLQKNILFKQNTPVASVTTDLGFGKFGSHQVDKVKNPWKNLAEKVCWQIDAIQTISRTISCSLNKGNVWMGFVGPDRVGKWKIATGLAEIVFGNKENFLSLDLNSHNSVYPSNTVFDFHDSKHHDLKTGRKMIVDYLAEELRKQPSSVIFLQDIEKADICVQHSLSRALKTGKFQDSHGRDISIRNTVFILTSSVGKVSEDRRVPSEYSEERVLEAKNSQMQIIVKACNGNYSRSSTSNVSVIPRKFSSKRKSNSYESVEGNKSKRCMIDLNLPVEDMEEESDDDADNDKSLQNSEPWLEELFEDVDESIEFKPFDFHFLSEKILKEIDVRLRKVVGDEIFLDIDTEVMPQILAAAWLAGSEDSWKDWIENILCSSIEEARKRYNITSGAIVQLVQCSGLVEEQYTSGLCLPSRININ